MSEMSEEEFLKLEEQLAARRRELGVSEAPPKPPVRTEPQPPIPRRMPPLTPEQIEARQRRADREWAEAIERCADLAARPDELERQLLAAGVSKRHRGIALRDDLIPKALRDWAAGFPGSLEGASAVIAGPPGTGKTAASVWLLGRAFRSGEVVSGDGSIRWVSPSIGFVSASELFAAVFEKKSLAAYERPALLVIDDWGMAYESEWPLAFMDRLLDRRWSEMRSTVMTTNLTPQVFAERYPRVASRLCDAGGPGMVPVVRADLRRQKP